MSHGESHGPSSATLTGERPETIAYLEGAGGERIYSVLHRATGRRRGAVLLAGPIGAERERAWRTLVVLARALAEIGFDVLRFDYRGIGESEGCFEELGLSDWANDTRVVLDHLRTMAPGAPVVACGVRAGCLPASRAFKERWADAMLLLAPPAGGRELLMDTLRRTLMADMMANPHAPRQSREQIAAAIEGGGRVNIDGYFWSPALWNDSSSHTLFVPPCAETRAWKILDFQGLARTKLPPECKDNGVLVAAERFWEHSGQLIPASTALFDAVAGWIDEAVERAGP